MDRTVGRRIRHRFTFDRIGEAYEVFGDAAANSALKVVITP